MRKVAILSLTIVIGFLFSNNSYAGGWTMVNTGSNVSEAKAVAVDRDGTIYAGFKEGLYKSINRGKRWELLGSPAIKEINFLYIDKQDFRIIYAATENGLFRSKDAGKNWQKIFTGKDALERDVKIIIMATQPLKVIFIVTGAGLFFSPVNRIIWQKVGGKLSDADISFLVQDKNNEDTFYIASGKGLFRTFDRMAHYEKIYNSFNLEYEDNILDVDSDNGDAPVGEGYSLRCLAIDPNNNNSIYIGTDRGIITSLDQGQSFKFKNVSGLLDKNINYILISDKDERFLLGTGKGVFDCWGDFCAHLYRGADFKEVNQLYLDKENNLYAASGNGLFVMALKNEKPSLEGSISGVTGKYSFNNEPGIRDIQREAIEYAEVGPEKIKLWREQAAKRALLPKFSTSVNRDTSDLWHWEAGSSARSSDDVLVRGRDTVGWDVALTWDLGDLVWNNDQTSIDTRSRLMVQLRDDILNEVTRLYFERKRLRMELSDNLLGAKIRVEKELRFQELSAGIDGLTGGYLSKCLEEK